MRREILMFAASVHLPAGAVDVYEGDTSDGHYSSATPPRPIEEELESPLWASMREEWRLGSDGCLEWKLEQTLGRQHLVLYRRTFAESAVGLEESEAFEWASIYVGEFDERAFVEDGLTIANDLGERMPEVWRDGRPAGLRPRKKSVVAGSLASPINSRKAQGPPETEQEFYIRLMVSGEERPFLGSDLSDERPHFEDSHQEILPVGSFSREMTVDVLGHELVRKVLSRRKPVSPFAQPIERAEEEHLLRALDL